MKDFINGLMTKGGEVVVLKSDVESGKKEVKHLKDVIVRKDDTIDVLERDNIRAEKYFNREVEDINDKADRTITLAVDEVDGKIEKVEFETAKEVTRVKDSAEHRVRRVKEESAHREEIMKNDHSAEIKSIKMTASEEAEEDLRDDINDLTDELAEAHGNVNAEMARAEERAVTITTLQGELKKHDELIRFVMTKLPSVDLSKFNINIDVPAVQVVTVKGGDQKKK